MTIFNFIRDHYQLVLSCLVALISIIMFLVRKQPNKIIDTISEKLVLMLPNFIRYAEDKFGSGNGINKKQYVIDLVKVWFSVQDLELTDYYLKLVDGFIEEILSTPTKK